MESDIPPSEPINFFIWLSVLLVESASFYILPILLILLLLLVASALISGSEVAFFSLSPAQLDELRDSEDKSELRVKKLLERPRLLLATILISNNFVNVSIIILFNFLMVQLLPDFSEEIIAVVNAALLTPILVFFGEVSPKVFATQNNLFLAKTTARFFTVLRGLTYPLGWLLVKSGLLMEKRFERFNHEIDLEEIEKAIDLSTSDGTSQEDVEILKGIVHFGNTTVKQIMVPRIDIVAVKLSYNFKEILDLVRDSGYSRMPVFEEDFDKITGILYAKDLLPFLDQPKTFNWQALIRDNIIFAPEAKKINIMLKEFQSSRMHLAVVVDEYGGTLGIVTLEDILEEVIGDIKDEFDDEVELVYQRLDKDNFIFEGKTLLNDIYKILEIDTNYFEAIRGEADSIAGLLLEIAKTIPTINTEFRFKSFVFKVISVDKKRIKEVKITRT